MESLKRKLRKRERLVIVINPEREGVENSPVH